MKKVFILLILMLIPLTVSAWDVTVTGVNVTISYTEPTTNEDVTPLTDLKDCTVFYNIGGGWVTGKIVPASVATGGGSQSTVFEVPITQGMERDVQFKGTCADISGNISKDSNIVTKRIDRLAPGTFQ